MAALSRVTLASAGPSCNFIACSNTFFHLRNKLNKVDLLPILPTDEGSSARFNPHSYGPRRGSREIFEDLLSRWDDSMSEVKDSILIECRRRMEWNVGGGSAVQWTDNLVKMGKWSDGEQLVIDKDGPREESEEVITRSRIWFWLQVEKLTWWIKLKEIEETRIER